MARYFAAEQAAIEKLEAERDVISRQIEEMDEEHGGEDGLLAEAKNDKGKLTTKSVKDRFKAIKTDPGTDDEREMLNAYAALMQAETAAKKKVNTAEKALDALVAVKYGELSEAEIETLARQSAHPYKA